MSDTDTETDANAYNFKNKDKRTVHFTTVILSRCKMVCNKCPVVYYDYKTVVREFCCCRCHSHAKASPPENDRYPVGIEEQLKSRVGTGIGV